MKDYGYGPPPHSSCRLLWCFFFVCSPSPLPLLLALHFVVLAWVCLRSTEKCFFSRRQTDEPEQQMKFVLFRCGLWMMWTASSNALTFSVPFIIDNGHQPIIIEIRYRTLCTPITHHIVSSNYISTGGILPNYVYAGLSIIPWNYACPPC